MRGSFVGGTAAFLPKSSHPIDIKRDHGISAPPKPGQRVPHPNGKKGQVQVVTWRDGDPAWLRWRDSRVSTVSVEEPEPIRAPPAPFAPASNRSRPSPSAASCTGARAEVARSAGFLDPVQAARAHARDDKRRRARARAAASCGASTRPRARASPTRSRRASTSSRSRAGPRPADELAPTRADFRRRAT